MLGGNIADRTETLSLAIYNQVMDVGSSDATIDFVIRHDGIAACTEEVQRIIQHCGAQSFPQHIALLGGWEALI